MVDKSSETHVSYSTLQFAAAAPASKQACTLLTRFWHPASVGLRMHQFIRVYWGIMLGAVPPSSNTPCTLSSGLICCRNMETFTYAATAASNALIPFHGSAPACDARPLKMTLVLYAAMLL